MLYVRFILRNIKINNNNNILLLLCYNIINNTVIFTPTFIQKGVKL